MYLQTLIPVIGLLVNVLAQVLGFRLIPRLGMLKSLFLGFAAGMAGVALFELGAYEGGLDFLGLFTVNMVTYFALAYCYFNFINLGETARRIRIVREIYDSGGLTMEEILKRYNADEIIKRRLDRLIANGQVVHRDHRYTIGNKAMSSISAAIILLKLLIIGKKSEHEN